MRGTGVLHSIFAGYTSSAEDFAGHGKDVIRQMLAGTSYANRSDFSPNSAALAGVSRYPKFTRLPSRKCPSGSSQPSR